MNVHIVYAHHEPSSFTAALKNTSLLVLEQAGHTITVSDLYGQGFQPLAEKVDFVTTSPDHFNYMVEQKRAAANNQSFSPDISGEIQKVVDAELIIFHFPLWWQGVPAMLKGWFDRVLVKGVAYNDHGEIYDHGLFRGKKALVVTTTADPPEFYKKDGQHRATVEEMLFPVLYGTLAQCGMDVLQPYVVYDILSKNDQERTAIIEMFREFIAGIPVSQSFYSRFSAGGGA